MRKILSFAVAILPGALFGQSWSTVGTGTDGAVTCLSVNTSGDELYAGGSFDLAGATSAGKLANWSAGSWSDLGADMDYPVHALSYINGKLYVGGEFLTAGGGAVNRIAVYENGVWSTLGNGLVASVNKIVSFNNEIYAGTLSGLYKWDGSTWQDMGLTDNTYAIVTDLEVYQGELYAVGSFDQAGGVNVNGIAKWNGTAWSAIGVGSDDLIDAIQVWNNELYIGGVFTTINGVSAGGFAKWNGTTIEAVGTGVPVVIIGFPNRVSALEVHQGSLYLGGLFQSIDGVNASNIAKYDGTDFSPLGQGTNNSVYALHDFQNELMVGGSFTQAGGQNASYIAKWSGVASTPENDYSTISIYPVPTKDDLIIELGDLSIDGYMITSASGKLIKESNESYDQKFSISLVGEEAGIYFISLKTEAGDVITKRVIKN